jgi:hypothetical protein
MKAVHASLALSIALATSILAQETAPEPAPAPPSESSLKLALPGLEPAPAPAPAPPSENLGLIPETPEPTTKPKGSALSQPKTSKKAADAPSRTSVAESDMAARIRFRQLKTKVLGEKKVQELYVKAQAAPNDYEQREGMKAYYTLLYTRIEKLDSSLKKRATTLRNQSINRMAQTKVDPTDPIDPSERSDRTRWE